MCVCWLVAIGLTGGAGAAVYFVATKGGDMALKKEKESHLKLLNEARGRSGKRPLTMEEFERGDAALEENPIARAATAPPALPIGAKGAETGGSHAAAQEIPMAKVVATPVAMYTIVLLEKEFRSFDQPKLRGLVEKAWGVQFSGGEGATEWVVCSPPPAPAMISCGGYRFLVHNVPKPYFAMSAAEVEAVAEERTRTAIRNSRAYRAVDLLKADGGEALPRENAYALLGKLAAELAGNGTLGIYLPELKLFFPYTDATLKALMADDVIGSLESAKVDWVPVLEDDDEELIAAMAEARKRFREFEEAWARKKPGSGPFVIKAAFTDGEHTEYMWVEVTDILIGIVTGFLRSSPVQVTGLVQDEEVIVNVGDISDWIAVMNGKTIGNFTGPIIERRQGGEPSR